MGKAAFFVSVLRPRIAEVNVYAAENVFLTDDEGNSLNVKCAHKYVIGCAVCHHIFVLHIAVGIAQHIAFYVYGKIVDIRVFNCLF